MTAPPIVTVNTTGFPSLAEGEIRRIVREELAAAIALLRASGQETDPDV